MRHYYNFCFYVETSRAHYSLVLFFLFSVCLLPIQKLPASHQKVLGTAEVRLFLLRTGCEIPFEMFGLVYFFLEYIGEGPECPFQKFTNAGDSM